MLYLRRDLIVCMRDVCRRAKGLSELLCEAAREVALDLHLKQIAFVDTDLLRISLDTLRLAIFDKNMFSFAPDINGDIERTASPQRAKGAVSASMGSTAALRLSAFKSDEIIAELKKNALDRLNVIFAALKVYILIHILMRK